MNKLKEHELCFINDCLNEVWNNCHKHLERPNLGDIERQLTEQRKAMSYELMCKIEKILDKI